MINEMDELKGGIADAILAVKKLKDKHPDWVVAAYEDWWDRLKNLYCDVAIYREAENARGH